MLYKKKREKQLSFFLFSMISFFLFLTYNILFCHKHNCKQNFVKEKKRMINNFITQRVLKVSNHILKTNDTIRQTANFFHLSKSTVHYDVSVRLKNINFILFLKIKSILFKNYNEKHIRGQNSVIIKNN